VSAHGVVSLEEYTWCDARLLGHQFFVFLLRVGVVLVRVQWNLGFAQVFSA